ncbi:MAG: RimK/LysX family protein [Parvibaculum sp.]
MHHTRALSLALAILTFVLISHSATAASRGKEVEAIAGWVEHVTLPSFDRLIIARLDTGAKTSSIYATDLVVEERDGRSWVSFTVPGDENGEELRLEKRVRRSVLIKRGTDEYDRRYVVDMEVCFNGHTYKTQVNLADRAHLNYPMLLGRRFLRNVALVHSGKTFITEPTCGDDSNG